jgi:hypothetical protein
MKRSYQAGPITKQESFGLLPGISQRKTDNH